MLVWLPAVAQADADVRMPVVQHLAVDGESSRSPSDLLKNGDWQTLGQRPNLGYDARTHWFRYSMPAPAEGSVERISRISYPQLDHVRFMLFRNGERVQTVTTGDRLPFTDRPIEHPQFLFPTRLEAGNDYQVLIRVRTSGAVQLPLDVWEPTALFEHLSRVDQAHALYYGILLVVILFNAFIFLALREKTYLYYTLAISSYLLFMTALRGSAFAVLWPQMPWLHNQMMLATIPATILFSALFVRAFLRLDRNNPMLDRIALGATLLGVLALIGAFVLDYSLSTRFSVILAVPAFLLLFIIGPIEWARGNRVAKFYTVAWAALTLGTAMAAMSKLGWLPTNALTEYGIEVGSALEALLLTMALAERLYRERHERVLAQDERLREHAERREAELRLIDQALHHPVTGLPNRTSFEMLLSDSITHPESGSCAVAVIQLSNLRAIQKTLGHANSERLLAAFAQSLDHQARNLACVRLTENSDRGEHASASLESASFALLLDVERMRAQPDALFGLIETLREPFPFLGMQLPLNPVGGVAIHPEHGDNAESLIRRAFIAQESEEAQHQYLAFYQPQSDTYSRARLTLASELRQALEQQQLGLAFQPKYSLEEQKVIGVEALIRWPGRETPPGADVLIAVAEETGLIRPLTRWVVRNALKARRQLLEQGFDLNMAVNISANNLQEPDFPLFIQNQVNGQTGILTVELTETAMMTDPVRAMKALHQLEAAGIPIAIDDFGTGYSSLSYIKRLPAREIKIDKALVTDITAHADDQQIVRATVDMAHSLGYHVVAEGVEDHAALRWLAELGCDAVQGYFISRPMTLEQLQEWLAGGSEPGRAIAGFNA
ncbi:MAG: EAL domain-containing protein [Halospina sp.]